MSGHHPWSEIKHKGAAQETADRRHLKRIRGMFYLWIVRRGGLRG